MLENEMDRGQPTPEKAQAAEPTGRLSSRRSFLSGSAKLLGGGALALGLGAPVALAQGSGDGVTDVKILNYALTLERLEYEFYRRMLSRFSERQIENADIFDGLGGYVRRTIHENLVRIREHEETHVETLVAVIKSLGGKPVPECEYDFGVSNVADFVRTARVLENTGVMAYDGR